MSSAPKLINKIEVSFKVIKNQIFINSLDLAKVFNKRHNNIIRTIKDLPQDEFKTLNFKNKVYLDAQMKPRPCYNLTRDGFSLLVMGFTGQKAYKWKIEFIKAFNEMEKRLKNIEQENIKKLAYHQSLGYKSQLEQQKKKYENEIKALKYDMAKKQDMRDNLKRLSFEEINI